MHDEVYFYGPTDFTRVPPILTSPLRATKIGPYILNPLRVKFAILNRDRPL